MTTLTMRMIKGNFVVTGPDVEPMKFKSRREARDWCARQHPGSPIEEIGRNRAAKPPPKRPPVKREAEEDWGSGGRKVTEETPKQANLVDEYAPPRQATRKSGYSIRPSRSVMAEACGRSVRLH